jgi:hypothetical protein
MSVGAVAREHQSAVRNLRMRRVPETAMGKSASTQRPRSFSRMRPAMRRLCAAAPATDTKTGAVTVERGGFGAPALVHVLLFVSACGDSAHASALERATCRVIPSGPRLRDLVVEAEKATATVWFEGSYQDYETDRKRPLGRRSSAPHRITSRKL